MMNRLKKLTSASMLCLTTIAVPAAAQTDSISAPAPTGDADAKVVQAHVDAYRSGNLDKFVATFAPDAQVEANGMVAVGHQQIRAFYAENFKPGAPKIKVVDSGMSGPNVYLSVGYTFADGSEMCCSYSEYVVENGKIAFLAASS